MVDSFARGATTQLLATEDRRRMTLALAALASAAFVYVTAETFPIGLLPQLSHGLHVSESSVGLLVTVYAGLAGLTAVPLTALSNHLPRRRLLVGAVALLAVCQIVVALAPDYATAMGARAVCAAAHGVFWAIIAPVAASLVAPERAGRATAAVFAGSSLALVLGTPLATALGVAFGWRFAAATVGLAAAVVCVALATLLPGLDEPVAPDDAHARLQAIRPAAKNLPLLSVCLITGVVVIGHFSAYTYISRLIQHDAGLSGLSLSLVLFGYGAAGILGNITAGWVSDRHPRRAVLGCTMTLALALILLAVVGPGSRIDTVFAVVLWGAAFTSMPVCMQSAVLRVAPADPDTASAIYVVAFQIGIGGGALAGSVLVGAGQLMTLPLVAATCFVLGTGLVTKAKRAFPPVESATGLG